MNLTSEICKCCYKLIIMITVLLSIMLLSGCNDSTHSKLIIENHAEAASSDRQTSISFIESTDSSSEESIDHQNAQPIAYFALPVVSIPTTVGAEAFLQIASNQYALYSMGSLVSVF